MPSNDEIILLGLPTDENSSFLRGPAQAPPLIRDALHSPAGNGWSEQGIEIRDHPRLRDAGDLTLTGGAEERDQIAAAVDEALSLGARVLSLGGDHAVTYPILRAYARQYPDLTILQIDAHPDLYDELDGNRFSHACPFARIMEAGLAGRLVQIGIRTLNEHQRQQLDRFGVEMVEMHRFDAVVLSDLFASLTGPLYLSLDLDGLDPAFAPGVSHHEPGGLSTRQVIDLIQRLVEQHPQTPLVGADVVEYNPDRDVNGVTAMVAAKLVREIISVMMK